MNWKLFFSQWLHYITVIDMLCHVASQQQSRKNFFNLNSNLFFHHHKIVVEIDFFPIDRAWLMPLHCITIMVFDIVTSLPMTHFMNIKKTTKKKISFLSPFFAMGVNTQWVQPEKDDNGKKFNKYFSFRKTKTKTKNPTHCYTVTTFVFLSV